MQLRSISYSESVGAPQEWQLEQLVLGNKNLIVGKNSTGKSRTLNVIGGIAKFLSTVIPVPVDSTYAAVWVDADSREYKYEFSTINGLVVRESLDIGGVNYLSREEGGVGSIYAEQIGGGMHIQFQTPSNELAVLKRRDSIQHGFIEPLYQWASQVRHYHFGATLGKDHIMIIAQNAPSVDDADENQVVGVFKTGEKEFGRSFIESIMKDMSYVGFPLDDITTGVPFAVRIEGAPGEIATIIVKEKGLSGITDQFGMSQGMYRVLALIIHINYLQFRSATTCVIVDDIGEGLDYERSCKVINLLREKAELSTLQVIMSTNDRFVMNEVPLKEWTVLRREKSLVSVSNYLNSAAIFDKFRFTGLSNFSFFEMDFLDSAESEDENA